MQDPRPITFAQLAQAQLTPGFFLQSHQETLLSDITRAIAKLDDLDLTNTGLRVTAIIDNLRKLDEIKGFTGKYFLQLPSEGSSVLLNRRALLLMIARTFYARRRNFLTDPDVRDVHTTSYHSAKSIEDFLTAAPMPLAQGWESLGTSQDQVWINVASQMMLDLQTLPLYRSERRLPPIASDLPFLTLASSRLTSLSYELGHAVDMLLIAIDKAGLAPAAPHGNLGPDHEAAILNIADLLLKKSDESKNYMQPLTVHTQLIPHIEKCLRSAGFVKMDAGWNRLYEMRKTRAMDYAQKQIDLAVYGNIPSRLEFAREAFRVATEPLTKTSDKAAAKLEAEVALAHRKVFEIVLAGAHGRIRISQTSKKLKEEIGTLKIT